MEFRKCDLTRTTHLTKPMRPLEGRNADVGSEADHRTGRMVNLTKPLELACAAALWGVCALTCLSIPETASRRSAWSLQLPWGRSAMMAELTDHAGWIRIEEETFSRGVESPIRLRRRIPVEQGKSYRLIWTARTHRETSVRVMLIEDGPPWKNLGLDERVTVDAWPRTMAHSFQSVKTEPRATVVLEIAGMPEWMEIGDFRVVSEAHARSESIE